MFWNSYHRSSQGGHFLKRKKAWNYDIVSSFNSLPSSPYCPANHPSTTHDESSCGSLTLYLYLIITPVLRERSLYLHYTCICTLKKKKKKMLRRLSVVVKITQTINGKKTRFWIQTLHSYCWVSSSISDLSEVQFTAKQGQSNNGKDTRLKCSLWKWSDSSWNGNIWSHDCKSWHLWRVCICWSSTHLSSLTSTCQWCCEKHEPNHCLFFYLHMCAQAG